MRSFSRTRHVLQASIGRRGAFLASHGALYLIAPPPSQCRRGRNQGRTTYRCTMTKGAAGAVRKHPPARPTPMGVPTVRDDTPSGSAQTSGPPVGMPAKRKG
jgi:hypothetical protein